MLGVVIQDVGDQIDFHVAEANNHAHFQGGIFRVFIPLLAQDLGGAADDPGPFRNRPEFPIFVIALVRSRRRREDFFIRLQREFIYDFPRSRIDRTKAHGLLLDLIFQHRGDGSIGPGRRGAAVRAGF